MSSTFSIFGCLVFEPRLHITFSIETTVYPQLLFLLVGPITAVFTLKFGGFFQCCSSGSLDLYSFTYMVAWVQVTLKTSHHKTSPASLQFMLASYCWPYSLIKTILVYSWLFYSVLIKYKPFLLLCIACITQHQSSPFVKLSFCAPAACCPWAVLPAFLILRRSISWCSIRTFCIHLITLW